MSEKYNRTPEETATDITRSREREVSSEKVDAQIDEYLSDASLHVPGAGAVYGDIRSNTLQGGSVTRGTDNLGTQYGHLEVSGDIDGQRHSSDIGTGGYGRTVSKAVTSDGKSMYWMRDWGSVGVGREAQDGTRYVHHFMDKKKAGELIVSIASKRADKIVRSKQSKE